MPSAAAESVVNLCSARNVQCFVAADFFLAWQPFLLDGESAANSPLNPVSSPCLGAIQRQSVSILNAESMVREAVERGGFEAKPLS
jgi:hypothetical protein